MRLGFGHTTGLDIPGEAAGRVPTPEWRKAYYETEIDKLWKPGNSITLAIGQDDLQATPLQTAVAYAAVANGGMVVRPHLGVKIVDSRGRARAEDRPPRARRSSTSRPTRSTSSSRGWSWPPTRPSAPPTPVFGGYPVEVAGKTGTAEVWKNGRYVDYSWYASFAPADKPRYAVVVVIEQGGHGGTAAAPATRKIYDALFDVERRRVRTGATERLRPRAARPAHLPEPPRLRSAAGRARPDGLRRHDGLLRHPLRRGARPRPTYAGPAAALRRRRSGRDGRPVADRLRAPAPLAVAALRHRPRLDRAGAHRGRRDARLTTLDRAAVLQHPAVGAGDRRPHGHPGGLPHRPARNCSARGA